MPIESSWVGVAVRLSDGSYTTEPPNEDHDLHRVLQLLNCKVAFTMSSDITASLMDQISPFQAELYINPSIIKIEIVGSLAELATGLTNVSRKSYVCIMRQERLALVWNDSVEGILSHGNEVERLLIGIVSYT